MTESKHTQGPWAQMAYAGFITIDGAGWESSIYGVAEIDQRHPEAETNAALISAAPDLLSALESMQTGKGCFDTCRWEYSGRHHAICIEATYAIAKAKGETPCTD